MKKVIAVLLVTAVCAVVFCSCKIRSKEDYYGDIPRGTGGNVSLSIDCTTLIDSEYKQELKLLPEDAMLIDDTEIPIDTGSTVYEALKTSAKLNELALNTTGDDKSAYIVGINGIKAMGCGAQSGWVYKVNGEAPDISCGSYEVKDGDEIVFYYTLTLGEDID